MKPQPHRSHQQGRHTILRTPQVSRIALAISLSFPMAAYAAEYLVSNEADLRAAITTANTNGDTSAVIKMTQSFTMTDGTAFPTSTVPLTIDTNGFVLTRSTLPSPVAIPVNVPGHYTFNGDYVGQANAISAGHGLTFVGSGIQNTVILDGNVTGGARTTAGGGGGVGVNISAGNMTFINNGTVTGGQANNQASGNTQQSAGVSLATGTASAVINNGTIRGGGGIAGGFAGAGVAFGNALAGSKLVNNGDIYGGAGTGGATGNVGLRLTAGTLTIENAGAIEGGNGAAAIAAQATSTLTVINSGSIIAGADTGGGRPNAIAMGAGGALNLELRAGSQIDGNVVASSGVNDTLTLGGTTNSSFDASLIGTQYLAFEKFVKTGSGTWTLTGSSGSNGSWTIEDGRLSLNTTLNTSLMTIAAPGTLGGTGTVVGNVTNAGTIAPGNSIGTLVINGNYAGNGGTIEIEGQLGGTGSPADRLLIIGNVSGTTTVRFTNVGGTGSATGSGNTDGISIIQVAGTSSASAFQLAGGYVAAGPYKYTLNVFDPASSAASEADPLLGAGAFYDYRLQSLLDASGNPVTVPQISAYQGMSTGAVRYGASLLDSVHKRLGELRRSELSSIGNGTDQNSQFFLRAQGSSSDVSGHRSAGYDQDIWFTQAGGNLFGKDMEDGATLRIGGAFSYGESKLNVDNSSAKVNLDGTTLAVTSTYQAAAGWYLDGVAQLTKYSADIRTDERGHTGSPDGLGYALSLEGGYPIDLGNGLVVEPQAQLSYQKIKFDRFTDADDISVDLRDGESLRGRFGGRLQKTFDANTKHAWSPFVEANLLHEFLGDGSIRAGNISFATDSLGTSVQLGGGVNAQLGANKMVFASVSYESGVSHAAADAWSGNIGVRVDW